MVYGTIPINKVYIDSRTKTKDTNLNSDFKYELLESIQLLDTCVSFIDDIIIPVSWYNIGENIKYIYVRRYQDLTDTKTDRIVPIEVSNRTPDTLTYAVQETLNTAFGIGVFSVSYDGRKLKLYITADSQSELKLCTDDELKGLNDWSGPAFNSNDCIKD